MADGAIELVPSAAGPYGPGDSVTIHVWLQNNDLVDHYVAFIRLDLTDSDPALSFDAEFTFDFSPTPATTDSLAADMVRTDEAW